MTSSKLEMQSLAVENSCRVGDNSREGMAKIIGESSIGVGRLGKKEWEKRMVTFFMEKIDG